jgi:hypothetical protein
MSTLVGTHRLRCVAFRDSAEPCVRPFDVLVKGLTVSFGIWEGAASDFDAATFDPGQGRIRGYLLDDARRGRHVSTTAISYAS